MTRRVSWYVRRLQAMGTREIIWRTRQRVDLYRWHHGRLPGVARDGSITVGVLPGRSFTHPALPMDVPPGASDVIERADQLMDGVAVLLGRVRRDLQSPDWHGERLGDVRATWELSRHQFLPTLAAAFQLTGDARYAERAMTLIESWCATNPVMQGVQWTSGIELGLRLLAWTWVRRLLSGWSPITSRFDDNPVILEQLAAHQLHLATFSSRYSSANNHRLGESAGLLVASSAFPWFEPSASWQRAALEDLAEELDRQTFPTGLDREQAVGYHVQVVEFTCLSLFEAAIAAAPVPARTWGRVAAMADALAAVVDEAGCPPRYGDADDSTLLGLHRGDETPAAGALALVGAVVGAAPWWPACVRADLRSALVAIQPTPAVPAVDRPVTRPSLFRDAGIAILRTELASGREIWCSFKAGPFGYLSIAAHAHADALAIELRIGGRSLIVDPGTYCFGSEPDWRTYFRSTRVHATWEIDGTEQAVQLGPFLWGNRADAELVRVDLSGTGAVLLCEGRHRTPTSSWHEMAQSRTVRLEPSHGTIRVIDRLQSPVSVPVAARFPLHPDVRVETLGPRTFGLRNGDATVIAELPEALRWEYIDRHDPRHGWYSPRFGIKVASGLLVGTGTIEPQSEHISTFTP